MPQPQWTGLEPLEPRLMMSAVPVARVSFTDDDGDVYTVRLTGAGLMAVSRVGAETDNRGPIAAIETTGTDAASILSVSVRRGPTGDGLVNIGSITGNGPLLAINAANCDLDGAGINLTGNGTLGSLKIRDILNGADVKAAGQNSAPLTTIRARTIGDGVNASDITLGGVLAKLTAAQVNKGTITAPSAVKIAVKGDAAANIPGDFGGTLKLTDGSAEWTLDSLKVARALTGAQVRVAATIRSITAGKIVNSDIFAGVSDAQVGLPDSAADFTNKFTARIASVKTLSVAGQAASFINSNIAAWKLGAVDVGSVQTDNVGTPFGLAFNTARLVAHTSPGGNNGDFTLRHF